MKQNLAAGLLMYRLISGELSFFLVHPGGPYFKKKEAGVWTIPKGLPEDGEALLDTALREFSEETGIHPVPPFHELGNIRQKSGKVVHAWAFEGSWAPADGIECNTFPLEWPPRSGKLVQFPEVDRAAWMDDSLARVSIVPEQIPFLDRAKDLYFANRH